MEFRILGFLEVLDRGRPVTIVGAKERALLTALLLRANHVVTFQRLLDELWGEDHPTTARKSLQVRASGLRKILGDQVITTRGAGYVLQLAGSSLDLQVFERLLESGRRTLDEGRTEQAVTALREALALWRGPPLADFAYEQFAQAAIHRLEELRLVALELRIEAELALGREGALVGELEQLVEEHPLREGLRAQLMLCLYRSGRQAEALEAYRSARELLVSALGIEPGPRLRELERAILEHDARLLPAGSGTSVRSILLSSLDGAPRRGLVDVAKTLARRPQREVILASIVPSASALTVAATGIELQRVELENCGMVARGAAFVSSDAAADVIRLSTDQGVDLLLLDAPSGLLDHAGLREVLAGAPCDVAVRIGRDEEPAPGAVLVPFTGAEHDWSAVELGAWFAGSGDVPLRLVGPADSGHDSSRLLANASLAVQRAFGVSAEPLLVDPDPERLLAAANGAAVVVVGLTARWRREGLGPMRTALATRARPPVLLVRHGLRPGGLAPPGSATRFTWTVGAAIA